MGKRDASFTSSISGMFNDALQVGNVQFNSWKNSLSDIMFPSSSSTSSTLTITASPAVVVGGVVVVAASAISIRSIWKMYSTRNLLRDDETNEYAPGPKPVPLVGNMMSLQAAYYETLYEYVDKPVSVFWIMSTPFVVVNDKDGLRKVLGGAGGLYTKPKYFGYRSKALKDAMQAKKDQVAEESIEYQPNGDASRKGLEQLIVSSFDRIKFSMENLLADLAVASEEEESGKLAGAGRFIRKAIVGLNLEVLFGLRQEGGKEDPGRIADMIDYSGTEFARRMVNPLKVWVDLPSNIHFFRDVSGLIQLGRRLCSVLDETAKNLLQNVTDTASAIANDASGLSWVHAWIGKVGKIGKLGKVVGLLMASTQTVPLTAVWMLHLIANNGIILKRLQTELNNQGIKSGSDLTYEHMTKLPLAEAVVRETLRLYPPFPLIQRQAQEDDILCGIRVAKGTIVYVVPWLVHRNSKYWSRAHEFCPERFLDDWQGDDSSDWIYVPFGRGARMCAGSKLAMTELKVLLCNAVLDYKWKSEQTEMKDERFPALGMNPRGVEMQFEKMVR